MRRLNPIERGITEALLVVIATSIPFWLLVSFIPPPSADLMRGLASLGTGLLLAYVVEAVWVTRQMRPVADYEFRLGAFVGFAVAGLVGTIVALLVAAHRAAEHANLLDSAGLSWAVVSLSVLGGLVVAQPLLVHEWTTERD